MGRILSYSVLGLFLITCSLLRISAQVQSPHFEQFQTEQGLPSREVYIAYQDKNGYMWFGTDNGVAKFDGYNFEVYTTQSGYEDNVINSIMEDRNGRLWFGSMFGGLFYLDKGALVSFKHNDIFLKLKGQFVTSTLDFIGKDNTFYLSLFDLGVLQLSLDGNFTIYRAEAQSNFILKTVEDRIIGCRSLHHLLPQKSLPGIAVITYIDAFNQKKIIKTKLKPSGHERFFNNASNTGPRYYFFIDRLCYMENGKLNYTNTTKKVNNLAIRNQHYLHLSMGNNLGLEIERSDSSSNLQFIQTLLPGQSVSNIIYDDKGGLWVTTINHGIFYCRKPQVNIWRPDANEDISCVAPVSETSCYFGSGIKTIYKANIDNISKLPIYPLNTGYCFDMEIINQRLYAYGGYYESGAWHLCRISEDRNRFFSFKELSYLGKGNILWVTNYRGFASLDLNTNLIIKRPLADWHSFTRIYDILYSKDGKIWIATQDGLRYYWNDKIHYAQDQASLMYNRINALTQINDNDVVAGSKEKGLLYISGKDLKTQILDQSIAASYIRNLYTDSLNYIWVSTNNGLFKYKIVNGKVTNKRHFTTAHGLPSVEVFQCKKVGKVVWIATAKGLVQFIEPPIEQFSPRPQILEIKSKKTRYDFPINTIFKHDDNNITIHFKTTNYRLMEAVRYRIRSGPGEEWRYMQSGSLELIGLPSGNYTYEIQSANEDDIWSESTTLTFEIATPWWKSWSFYLFSLLATMALLMVLHKRRTNRLRKEANLKNKIIQLEKMALQSQMNPHFLSNVFAAVQFFIHTQRTEQAEAYLSDVNALIRKILDNSRKAEVSLMQEMELLKLYIHLEQLRFEYKFDFAFEIKDNLHLSEIFIPPMMLQPIVENAINHGLHPLSGRRGKLICRISDTNSCTEISIEDNGIGRIAAMKNNKKRSSTSYGLEILKERITNLNSTQTEKARLTILDKDQVYEFGTTVTLQFFR